MLVFVLSVSVAIFANADYTENTSKDYPQDRINPDQINVYDNKFSVEGLKNTRFVKLKNAQSMYPVLAEGSHVIETTDFTKDSLKVGDIVSFQNGDLFIIHRVIEIGNDKNGWYVVTKGDNNSVADGKVRFEQLKGVVVAIVY